MYTQQTLNDKEDSKDDHDMRLDLSILPIIIRNETNGYFFQVLPFIISLFLPPTLLQNEKKYPFVSFITQIAYYYRKYGQV
jgi:hypothetical protein